MKYNQKFRQNEEYEDDNETPLYKLHVCKCGATFNSFGILNLHIDKKHAGDRSFVVKFVDTDPGSEKTVKV